MARRSLLILMLVAICASVLAFAGPASATTDYRPDAWIKLCGLSTGCTINPLPHPWRGNDVYNTTASGQALDIRMEEGEGVRYWITLQNDGALGDKIVVQGCKGNNHFEVNRVVLGLVKRPDAGATKVTNRFLEGTLKFAFPPSSENKKVVFTLNIIAKTKKQGVSYRCPITIHSAADPSIKDTVSATMTTI
ncbi:MAG: hypothetical protein M3P01_11175 [Actinomycetota bacterium]|nr:hypothetical protein [Actinomycetota bacterium]